MPIEPENNHNKLNSSIGKVTVYAAASLGIAEHYHSPTQRLGTLLAEAGIGIVYGGGRTGLMGSLADAALAAGGHVEGIIPGFLVEREVAHQQLSRLHVVEDMRIRKHNMLLESDGVIALPGGAGTLEELFEVITLKRLGMYHGAVVLLNTANYYQPLLGFLSHAGEQGFITKTAGLLAQCWQVAETPEQALAMVTNG